jgi:hypothetical protein
VTLARSRRAGTDAGAVTVEAAIGLATLVLALVLCLAGIGCAVTQIRCAGAAAAAARLAARGDRAAAEAAVAAMAPAGAVLSFGGDGDLVSATVSAPGVALLPAVRVGASAFAAQEDTGN